ncbi:hypothetical protein AALP_AA1G085800, partial [Arabis alpina]
MTKKKKKSPPRKLPIDPLSTGDPPISRNSSSPNSSSGPNPNLELGAVAMPQAVTISPSPPLSEASPQAAPVTQDPKVTVLASSVLPLAAVVTTNLSYSGAQADSSASGSHVQEPEASSAPNVSPKTSWSELVQGSSVKMQKKGAPFVLDSGEMCVVIPNEVIKLNLQRWDFFILCQFHGNLPSHGALHAIFNGIWSNKLRDITVSKLGPKTVLIRVPCPATRKRILSQALWHIEGQTMFVADYSPGLTLTMPSLDEVPVWLEFRGVPPHFYSSEGLEYVASILGNPQYCHPSTLSMTNLESAKVLTIIDPAKPIPEALNVQFETGERARVEVFCPWLPPICSFCNQVGHSIRRCPTAPITCQTCASSSHLPSDCPRSKKQAPPKVVPKPNPPKLPVLGDVEKTLPKAKKSKKGELGRRNLPLLIKEPVQEIPEGSRTE